MPSAVPAGDCRGQLGAHGAAAAGGRPELDPPGRRYCEQPAACDHATRSTHPPPASSSGSLAAAPPLPSPTSATPPSCPPEASTPRGDQSRQSAPPAWQAASRGAPPATEAITNSLSIPIAELVLDRAAGHARVPLLRPDQRAGVYAAGDSAGPSPGRGRHRVGLQRRAAYLWPPPADMRLPPSRDSGSAQREGSCCSSRGSSSARGCLRVIVPGAKE